MVIRYINTHHKVPLTWAVLIFLESCRRRFQHSAKALAGGQHFGKPLPSDDVIDGRSVIDFQHLPRSKQYAVAQEIGSSRTTIMDTLAQLMSVNTFF